jgi:hypothetical protein
MVERIDKRQRRRAIEGSAVIQGCSDANRCLVDIGDAEIDFPHDGVVPHNRGERRRLPSSMGVSAGCQQWDFEYCPASGCSLLKRLRCRSGWRRVRDAGCDGSDVSLASGPT